MTESQFLANLKNHHSSSIEAFLTPDKFRLQEDVKIDCKPNLVSLRHSYSHISSNSWVKCKKKIIAGEYYIGVKSLFHSLRIPMFGIQIVKYGKIVDFTEANYIHDLIFSKRWSWIELDNEFRPIRNKILTDFRLLTTK
jgi:hypothetical protein